MKAKKAAVKKTIKKAEKKPVVKKAVKTPAPKKAAIKKPVKKADKPLARNEKVVLSGNNPVKVYKRIPKGWKEDISYAAFTPKGYATIHDKEKNKFGYIEREWHNKMPVAKKNELHGDKPITVIKRSGRKITYGTVKKAGKTK